MSEFFKYQLARLEADPAFIVKKTEVGVTFVKGLKSVTVKAKGEDEKLYGFLYAL